MRFSILKEEVNGPATNKKHGLRLLQKQVDLSLILKEGEYSTNRKTSRMDCLHKQELDRGDEKKD